jgi:hypothetical protein
MVAEGKIKPIDALAKNILTTRFEDFDPATLDNAKNRVMEVIYKTELWIELATFLLTIQNISPD